MTVRQDKAHTRKVENRLPMGFEPATHSDYGGKMAPLKLRMPLSGNVSCATECATNSNIQGLIQPKIVKCYAQNSISGACGHSTRHSVPVSGRSTPLNSQNIVTPSV